MPRRSMWLVLASAILANGALLLVRTPVAADPIYLDCYWTQFEVGCTNGIVDRCVSGDIARDCDI